MTAANVNDGKLLDPVLTAIALKRKSPAIRRSKHLCADAGYRSAEYLQIYNPQRQRATRRVPRCGCERTASRRHGAGPARDPRPESAGGAAQPGTGAAAKGIAADTGLEHLPVAEGQRVDGFYRRSVMLASEHYAMLEDGMEFNLKQWRPVIE